MGKTEITSNHKDLSHPAKGFTPYQYTILLMSYPLLPSILRNSIPHSRIYFNWMLYQSTFNYSMFLFQRALRALNGCGQDLHFHTSQEFSQIL
jgi:hypothetical protein